MYMHEICSLKLTSNDEEETLAIVDGGLVVTEVAIHRPNDTCKETSQTYLGDERRLVTDLLAEASPGQQLEVLQ